MAKVPDCFLDQYPARRFHELMIQLLDDCAAKGIQLQMVQHQFMDVAGGPKRISFEFEETHEPSGLHKGTG